MSYIGNQPLYTSYVTDTFSGNGTNATFTLSIAPANSASLLVAISGVLQNPSDYGVAGLILTFTSPPPNGTNNISVRYLSLPASNVVTSAYRTVTDIIATAGQTVFSPASYTPGYVDVYRNGVKLGTSDYVATNGAQVILVNAAAVGDIVQIIGFSVGSVLNAIPANAGVITAGYLDVASLTGAGAMVIPTGTTAQRPTSPVAGMTRMNTTTGNPEWWDSSSSQWIPYSDIRPYAIDYLVVAGGGGGGGGEASNAAGGGGGGGGAGGMITGSSSITPLTSFVITIGGGGSGGASGPNNPGPTAVNGSPGTNSTLAGGSLSITAIGGGFGARDETDNGGAGGSGGGAGGDAGGQPGGAGTSGQGNNGGIASNRSGGGGGGRSAVGGSASGGGNGGAGLAWVNGSTYAGGGGGGGGASTTNSSSGGAGGGGAGLGSSGGNTANAGGTTTPGTANTGGGGGGMGAGRANGGSSGGSGVVIIRYVGSQRALGGSYSSSGGYSYHTFTSSGTYTA